MQTVRAVIAQPNLLVAAMAGVAMEDWARLLLSVAILVLIGVEVILYRSIDEWLQVTGALVMGYYFGRLSQHTQEQVRAFGRRKGNE